ncbi:unnamed protein product [Wuchereria bancrofti]|uniref:Uncharacterized protein n=1 Tax=Wuchereria bancrofti TaxID=6293 RepID=A0A3P7E413_WUCBA|nr:unnamed protein product [Wuchereria bancrofti]
MPHYTNLSSWIPNEWYGTNLGWFLARFCLLLPLALCTILVSGLTIFGLSFSKSSEREITPENIEKYPFQYFSEIHCSKLSSDNSLL